MLKVYPYKMESQSSKLLAQNLNAKRVYPDRAYQARNNHTIINWGSGALPKWNLADAKRVINHPTMVSRAANKLSAFNVLKAAGVSIPEFTTNIADVHDTLNDHPDILWMARKKLTGTRGEGIELIAGDHVKELLPKAPLYVRYMKKKHEFRIHVMGDEVFDMQQKRAKEGVEQNFQIRSHDNGWVFCRENLDVPDVVKQEAIKAVKALGLDFGAVDVIYNTHFKKACVLEVNTAPGLEGTTLLRYTEALTKYTK